MSAAAEEVRAIKDALATCQAERMRLKERMEQQSAEYVGKIEKLLASMGSAAICKQCSQKIYFVQNKAGKVFPVSLSGLPHFIDCPKKR